MKKYFIPRNTRLYNYVAHVRPLTRYGLTICILIGIWCIWFYGIYRPIENALNKRALRLQRTYEQIEHAHAMRQQCADLTTSCSSLLRHPVLEGSQEDGDLHYQNQLLSLLECIRTAQATLVSYHADAPVKKSVHTQYKAHVTMRSTLSCMANFFKQLERERMSVECTRLSCTKIDAELFTVVADFCFRVFTHGVKKDPST